MKHYILYYHGGSANHGCEALVRTTAELLDYKNNKITLASFRPEDDKKYGIDQFCYIHKMYEEKPVSRFDIRWIKAYAQLKLKHDYLPLEDLSFLNAVSAQKGDIAISIGGDNYCYNDNIGLRKANELWRRNGLKSVLWGCSIEPALLNDSEIIEDISRFDLITARESLSYEALKEVNKNTILVSDSAFQLKAMKMPWPDGFENKDIVGLNLSPLASSCEIVNGITIKNYEVLIEYILDKTDMSILLIPHVSWTHDNDNTINEIFLKKYAQSNRVKAIGDMNCEQLKGYIAKCRFFIGARTHATIAAYSSCVPTLVLGYSTKSKGIAKDLFNSYEDYVLPVQTLKHSDDLLNRYIWLVDNEKRIRERLFNILPEYKDSIYEAVELLKNM